jgi:hypothetical protein
MIADFQDSSEWYKRQIAYYSFFIPNLSIRMSLIIFFLAKEGGYITALAACAVSGVIVGFLLIFFVLIWVLIQYFCLPKRKKKRDSENKGKERMHDNQNPLKTLFERTAEGAYKWLLENLSVVWHLSVNLSTTHRIIISVKSILQLELNTSVKVCGTTTSDMLPCLCFSSRSGYVHQ